MNKITISILVLCFIPFGANPFSKKYNENPEYIDPGTAVTIGSAVIQAWQYFGAKDKSISQIINMLTIIDNKLDIINEQMGVVIEELQNVDERTYRFFKASEGEVLIKEAVTFDKALYRRLQNTPLTLRFEAKKSFILQEEEDLKEAAKNFHIVFRALEKYGNRPEIASYVAISYQMENSIYQYLLEAESTIIPKEIMKERQNNYLTFFIEKKDNLNKKLDKLNSKQPKKDIKAINKSFNSTFNDNVFILKEPSIQYSVGARAHDIPYFFDYKIKKDFSVNNSIQQLRDELGYNIDKWFLGLELEVTARSGNRLSCNSSIGKEACKEFIESRKEDIEKKLPTILNRSANEVIATCYAIENISQALFLIQRNENEEIYN